MAGFCMDVEEALRCVVLGLRLQWCRKTGEAWPRDWGQEMRFHFTTERTLFSIGLPLERDVAVVPTQLLQLLQINSEDTDATYLKQKAVLTQIPSTSVRKRVAVLLVSFNTVAFADEVLILLREKSGNLVRRIRRLPRKAEYYNQHIQAPKRNSKNKRTHATSMSLAKKVRPKFWKHTKSHSDGWKWQGVSKLELLCECAKLGHLAGKTLFRLLERACVSQSNATMSCFKRSDRVTLFACGPKKLYNLVWGNDLLEDTTRNSDAAAFTWNRKINNLTDKVYKYLRKVADERLLRWLGNSFAQSALSMCEWAFLLCECMGVVHYCWNGRLKSVGKRHQHERQLLIPSGRRVLTGEWDDDAATSSDESDAVTALDTDAPADIVSSDGEDSDAAAPL